jgi:hypothetical protein
VHTLPVPGAGMIGDALLAVAVAFWIVVAYLLVATRRHR